MQVLPEGLSLFDYFLTRMVLHCPVGDIQMLTISDFDGVPIGARHSAM